MRLLLLFIITFTLTFLLTPAIHATTNPCPDTQFLDLSTGQCRDFITDYTGYDPTWETPFLQPSASITLTTCTQAAFATALQQIQQQGGGQLVLPDCQLSLSSSINLPSNLIIQGAGIDQTTIQSSQTMNYLLRAKDQHNLVIRDLTIDGQTFANKNLVFWYADNLLIERIHSTRAAGDNLSFKYAQDFTVRYSRFTHSQTFHGLAVKDCDDDNHTMTNAAQCLSQFNSFSHTYGTQWSANQLIYSNQFLHNQTHGINDHGIQAEIAGNYSTDNGYGGKLFDAQDIWFHHNQIARNQHWGIKVNLSLDDPARRPNNLYFYANHFTDQSDFDFEFTDREGISYQNIYLLHNTYGPNAQIKISGLPADAVRACPDSADTSIPITGQPLGTAPDSLCLPLIPAQTPTRFILRFITALTSSTFHLRQLLVW